MASRARRHLIRLICVSSVAALAGGIVTGAPASARTHDGGGFAYFTNQYGNSVSVVDLSTMAVEKTIPVGHLPQGIAISAAHGRVFVSNWTDNTVSVIDQATNTVIKTLHVGVHPIDVAASPDGSRVAVSNLGSGTVSIIDPAADKVVSTVHLSSPSTQPWGAAFSPDGTSLAVTEVGAGRLAQIDTSDTANPANDPVTSESYSAGWDLRGVTYNPDPDKDQLYIAEQTAGQVDVFDTVNQVSTAKINTGARPTGILIAPDGSKAWISINDYSGGHHALRVSEIDLSTYLPINTYILATDSTGLANGESTTMALTPDGTKLLVPMQRNDKVAVIDTTKRDGSVSMIDGNAPTAVAITPGT